MKALTVGGLLLITGAVSPVFAVDFEKDVLPIFSNKCFNCHGEGEDKGGLSLEPEDISKHIRASKQIRPGDPERSLLIELVTSEDPDDRMPPRGGPLNEEQIGTIKAWIEEGAEIGGQAEEEEMAEEEADAPAEKQPLEGTWTNKGGVALKGKLTGIEGNIALLYIQGTEYRVPIDTLSEESQAKVREWEAQ